jgi:hypothetical protein
MAFLIKKTTTTKNNLKYGASAQLAQCNHQIVISIFMKQSMETPLNHSVF